MAKRLTKKEYMSKIGTYAAREGLELKTNMASLEKITLKTKISLYHEECEKTRNTTVGSFFKYPECQYCSKVNSNKALILRREKAYAHCPKPADGKSTKKKRIYNKDKVGPLKKGQYHVNRKPSEGEIKVAEVLESLKVPYEVEVPIYVQSKQKTPFRADFVVTLNNHKYIIEYDGGGHFYAIKKYGGAKQYYRRLRMDEAKDNFAKRNKNYSMLRIPYWEDDNIEYWIRKYLPLN